MKTTLAIMLAAGILSLNQYAHAQADCSDGAMLEVNGYGKVEAMPDRAVLSYSASATDMDSKAAKAKVEKQVSSFVRGVRGFGVDNENIISDSITIMPKYEYLKDEPRKFAGYEATRAVTVKVKDFTLIEKITTAAVESGISDVNGFYYELSDVTELKKQADAIAMKDAQDKAKRLADGFDVDLKKVCSLKFAQTQSDRMMRKSNIALMSAVNDGEASPEVYSPEKQQVESNVSASYLID